MDEVKSDKLSPERVAQEVENLHTSLGHVPTPDELIHTASAADHPLHQLFEWDDSKAGHQYRLMQARAILRRVESRQVTIVHPPREISVDMSGAGIGRYIRDPDAGYHQQGYVEVSKIRSDETLTRKAVLTELRYAKAYINRARHLGKGLKFQGEQYDDLLLPISRLVIDLCDRLAEAGSPPELGGSGQESLAAASC